MGQPILGSDGTSQKVCSLDEIKGNDTCYCLVLILVIVMYCFSSARTLCHATLLRSQPDTGWNFYKLWAKMSFSFFKFGCWYFCPAMRKKLRQWLIVLISVFIYSYILYIYSFDQCLKIKMSMYRILSSIKALSILFFCYVLWNKTGWMNG